MSTNAIVRPVRKTWKSQPTMEGAGVAIRRAFGFDETSEVDPFLLLDDFRSENPEDYKAGFPWHPHRGIETITYVLEGNVEHEDSLGNAGVISSGDVQWMTAGSGIIHQEMPQGDRKRKMAGFQLWSNLPRRSKMMGPRYQEVKSNQIPTVRSASGAVTRLIAGELEGVRGPVRDVLSDPEYLDVSVPPGTTFSHGVKPDHNVFAYVFEGEAIFDPRHDPAFREAKAGRVLGDGSVVLFGAGEQIQVTTGKKPVRFLLVSGKPLKEPVAWYGPIVMNTREELRTAFEEYEQGTFVKEAKR